MLSIAAAIARPTRRTIPVALQWMRYNSTGAPQPPAPTDDEPELTVEDFDPSMLPAGAPPDAVAFEGHDVDIGPSGPANAGGPRYTLGRGDFIDGSPAVSIPQQYEYFREQTIGLPKEEAEASVAASILHGRSVLEPVYHPRPHGVPVAQLHIRSFVHRELDFFAHFASHAAAALGIPITRPAMLPTQRRLWTLMRSPFVHKKSQENFERKVHKRVIKAYDADREVVDRWVRYIRQHRMASVGMRVVRWERAPVSVGTKMLGKVVASMRDEDQVKQLGEEIIRQELAAQAEGVRALEAGGEPTPKSAKTSANPDSASPAKPSASSTPPPSSPPESPSSSSEPSSPTPPAPEKPTQSRVSQAQEVVASIKAAAADEASNTPPVEVPEIHEADVKEVLDTAPASEPVEVVEDAEKPLIDEAQVTEVLDTSAPAQETDEGKKSGADVPDTTVEKVAAAPAEEGAQAGGSDKTTSS